MAIKSPLEISMRLLEEMSEAQLTAAFLALPRENDKETCRVATLPENEVKNRYRDVLPYDSNRAILIDPGVPKDPNFNDYINASHIHIPISGEMRSRLFLHGWWDVGFEVESKLFRIEFIGF